jgi:hypothetical protein
MVKSHSIVEKDNLFYITLKNDFSTQFDKELFKRWDNAMESGCFKYNLDSVERRIIPGKYNFVAQVISMCKLSLPSSSDF